MLLIHVRAAFATDYVVFFEGQHCERDKSADSWWMGGGGLCVAVAFDRWNNCGAEHKIAFK